MCHDQRGLNSKRTSLQALIFTQNHVPQPWPSTTTTRKFGKPARATHAFGFQSSLDVPMSRHADPPLSFIKKKNMVVRSQLSPPSCLVTPLYPLFPRSVTRFFARLSTVSRASVSERMPSGLCTFVQSSRIIMCEHVRFLERIEIHTCALLLTFAGWCVQLLTVRGVCGGG